MFWCLYPQATAMCLLLVCIFHFMMQFFNVYLCNFVVYFLVYRFVLYLSALCDDASQGKKLLNAAKNALFEQPISGYSETETFGKSVDNIVAQGADTDEQKPPLVWSASYIQEINEV